MNTKIFVLYHKPSFTFKSEIFEPMQTGCVDNSLDLGFLKDSTGDNISFKNKHYGELSAWYWVWKNYLPKHPNLKYIGFCHYRRFLDFFQKPKIWDPFRNMSFNRFIEIFNSYNSFDIEHFIQKYEIVLPKEVTFDRETIYSQYEKYHIGLDLQKMIKIYETKYPMGKKVLWKFLNGHKMYPCLNFVIKRELFERLCSWVFDLLFELEKNSDWENYREYNTIRTPAFLAERFINVFFKLEKLKIKEVDSYCLSEFESFGRFNHMQRIRRRIRRIFRDFFKKYILFFK